MVKLRTRRPAEPAPLVPRPQAPPAPTPQPFPEFDPWAVAVWRDGELLGWTHTTPLDQASARWEAAVLARRADGRVYRAVRVMA